MAGAMAGRSSFTVYDSHVFGGRLARKLARWREQGESYEDIAFLLRTKHGVNVSSQTVRRWLRRLDNVA